MTAQYTMQEVNDLNHEGETLLYPRIVSQGCCDTAELAESMAKGTTFTSAEMSGVIALLQRGLVEMMAQGKSVRLDGIGTFSPSLALKEGREREAPDGSGTRRNASSIEVGHVHFRPDRTFIATLNAACRLERAPELFARRISPHTPEERLQLARTYLENHPWLDIATYARLTGLSRTTAGRELRKWHTTPGSGIGIEGRGTHRVYVKQEE